MIHMVSYTNLFLIKGMTCWNGMMGWVRWARRGWDSLRSVFHPEAGAWFLFPHTIFPVCYRDVYGMDAHAEWKYYPTTNTLCFMGHAGAGAREAAGEAAGEKRVYRLGWLSAQTVTTTETKDMDAFLSDVRVISDGLASPPLMVLLQAWSLYERRWWSADPSVRIEWIDALAEEHAAGPMEPCVLPLVLRGGR